MGVEEEYLLVGPDGVPVAVAGSAVKRAPTGAAGGDGGTAEPGGDVETELTQQQLETGTRPCTDRDALAREIRDGRRRAQEAAKAVRARIAALGTSPLAVTTAITPDPRYLEMAEAFALTAREQLTCGCHVHVAVDDEEEGVAVLDRIAPWLAPLTAMSANSPFWDGVDSGYSSYRSLVWSRWPTAGPVAGFGSAAAYRALVDDLVASGTILDEGMLYFDARLSARYPTVEVRVADVCLRPEDALLVALLARGLVETAAREAADGVPVRPVRAEHLRVSSWRAARSGMTADLLSPTTFRPAPAATVVSELVEHVAPALADTGDLEHVRAGVEDLVARGTGARHQREWVADGGPAHVVEQAVTATLA